MCINLELKKSVPCTLKEPLKVRMMLDSFSVMPRKT